MHARLYLLLLRARNVAEPLRVGPPIQATERAPTPGSKTDTTAHGRPTMGRSCSSLSVRSSLCL